MSVLTRESRPVGSEAASQNNQAGQALPSVAVATVTGAADTLPRLDADDLAAEHVRGVYVVVTHLWGERHRRKVTLTLAAAQRAADRARERGHNVTVVLARLEPVAVVP